MHTASYNIYPILILQISTYKRSANKKKESRDQAAEGSLSLPTV